MSESLDSILARLDAARRGKPKTHPGAAHAFARIVDELGFSAAGLDPKAKFTCLVREVKENYEAILTKHPDDAVSLNNLAVFHCNDRHAKKARPLFAKALQLAPDDARIHLNLRTADILTHAPKDRWHAVPDGLAPGTDTLSAYFDPHGM